MTFNHYDGDWDKKVDGESLEDLEELLIGRKIVEVDDDDEALILDNGVRLYPVGNEGCGGCSAGNWWISHLASYDHAITGVKIAEEDLTQDYNAIGDHVVRVFVWAESDVRAAEIITAKGYEDNGFYGQGYEIYVVNPNHKEDNQ